jgi:hypothetical protein
MIGKEAVHPLGGLSMRFFRFEPQPDVNSLNDENIVLQLHFAHGLRDQPLVRRADLTRFQRASKGSRKSTGCCGDNVVQGCGMRFQHIRWNFVMFGHRAMNSEDHWLLLRRQVCSADRALHAFDTYMRSISHVMHDCGIVSRYSFARMTSTGHGACRMTASATLPNNARWIP